MQTLQILGAIVALLLLIVGPGSGLYIALRKTMNGALLDIAEIKQTLANGAKRYDEDHTGLMVALERLATHDGELERLRDFRHTQEGATGRFDGKLDMVLDDLDGLKKAQKSDSLKRSGS